MDVINVMFTKDYFISPYRLTGVEVILEIGEIKNFKYGQAFLHIALVI